VGGFVMKLYKFVSSSFGSPDVHKERALSGQFIDLETNLLKCLEQESEVQFSSQKLKIKS
jgi:hypothetical protein